MEGFNSHCYLPPTTPHPPNTLPLTFNSLLLLSGTGWDLYSSNGILKNLFTHLLSPHKVMGSLPMNVLYLHVRFMVEEDLEALGIALPGGQV